jgi:cytochrome c-type biogenesis protein CcmF
VFTGTTYPLFAELVFGAKISVGPPFFTATVFPLCAPVFAAMVVGPVLPWKRADLAPALLRLWYAALAAAVVGVVATLGYRLGLTSIAFVASAWIIVGSTAEIVGRTGLFRLRPSATLARARGLSLAVWGSSISHAGMGVLIAGVAGMSLAQNTIVAVPPGVTVDLGGYQWKLLGMHDSAGSNYAERVADLEVSRNGQPVADMHPSRRSFVTQKVTTTEAAIRTNGFRDLYAVLGEERDGSAVLRLHVNPLAPWIWLGGLTMAFGGALSLADRRLRIGAPARRRVAAAAVPAE